MGPTGPGNLFIAALNTFFYDDAKNCGQCYNIFSPYTNRSVVVMATDQCPGGEHCSNNNYHFDLSPQAFDVLGARSIGVLKNLEFYKVPCQVDGNVKIMMKDGSNDYWTAFLIFNSDIGIKQVSVKKTGSDQFVNLKLSDYNYWISPDMKPGEFEVRIESLGGEFINTKISAIESNKIVDTQTKFTTAGCVDADSSAFAELPNSSSKLSSALFFVLSSIILFIF
ncbi:hypothetical protein DICPUDRAFT_95343 [Dictyostelium purpureum]|uniref:Expansin-like EG45 domain-containing protein n=1 Tax=Dictyostelium purpureum TaxID=5786 RepID=F0ZVB6_DICPU|nr:uncharacterized protein DICPUDRAFT_95343 [Dictyostelium purpureum]EGC32116.1 hypothetical protein DICPUDRAFT_95343 [Dictyostelium purpureum]|eukprot:XP_003291366.1 hypothetical protein DICPUDRAFT_95343 [Dictyostelium purpureum]